MYGNGIRVTVNVINDVVMLVGANFVVLGLNFDNRVMASIYIVGFFLLVDELLQLGVSENDIQKIMKKI